ncbi:MAG TPA: DMT family transporter [Bryobacteraceae bacterium]|nr:DMT family transporter [Bryobacteraceae bacterium]
MKARRAELALAGMTVVWGTTFVLVKGALADVSTILFLTLRFTLAAVVLALLYRTAVRRQVRSWRALGPGALAGGLLFGAFVLQTAGLKLTTASKSAFLTGLSIPMVPLASSLVYRIKPRMFEVAGVLIASLGMALMTLPTERFEMSRGDGLSFLCAVGFALHIVVVSHYTPLMGFESVAVLQVVMAAVLGLAAFGWVEPVVFHLSAAAGWAVVITGLFGTALGFTTMSWAQQYTSATRTALIFALEPVVAWLTSWFLTGETMPLRGRIGAALILAGIVLVEVRRPSQAETAEVVTAST